MALYLSILPSMEDEVSFDLMLADVAMKEKLTKHINSNNYNSAIEECIIWALKIFLSIINKHINYEYSITFGEYPQAPW